MKYIIDLAFKNADPDPRPWRGNMTAVLSVPGAQPETQYFLISTAGT